MTTIIDAPPYRMLYCQTSASRAPKSTIRMKKKHPTKKAPGPRPEALVSSGKVEVSSGRGFIGRIKNIR